MRVEQGTGGVPPASLPASGRPARVAFVARVGRGPARVVFGNHSRVAGAGVRPVCGTCVALATARVQLGRRARVSRFVAWVFINLAAWLLGARRAGREHSHTET